MPSFQGIFFHQQGCILMLAEDSKRFPPVSATLRSGAAVVIRLLTEEDGDKLTEFYESVPRCDLRFYCPSFPLDRERALQKTARAGSPCEVVLVMEMPESQIAGYGWYKWDKPEVEQSTFGLCIRPDFQSQGAGRLLMARIAEIAREIGPPVMNLTVQLANERAVALYKKMGFIIVREQMRAASEACGFAAEPEYYMERMVR